MNSRCIWLWRLCRNKYSKGIISRDISIEIAQNIMKNMWNYMEICKVRYTCITFRETCKFLLWNLYSAIIEHTMRLQLYISKRLNNLWILSFLINYDIIRSEKTWGISLEDFVCFDTPWLQIVIANDVL